MPKICGIYKITNPKDKIYIGQSIDCLSRKNKYSKIHCKGQTKLCRSIQKYGWEAHKFEIINQCKPEQLNDLEKYYIDLYQTFNSEFGLNLKTGGTIGYRHSEETKDKMSISRMGKPATKGSFTKEYWERIRQEKLTMVF